MSRIPLAVLVLALLAPVARAENVVIHHQGRLLNSDDTPVTGQVALKVSLHDTEEGGGDSVWSADYQLQVADGLYSVALGRQVDGVGTALPHTAVEGPRWLSITVNGTKLEPRLAIGHVPQAVHAHTATSLSGGSVDATIVKVNGVTALDADGRYVGPTDQLKAAFLGDHPADAYLRGVTTGAGLTGAGTASDPLRTDLPALDAVVAEVDAARGTHHNLSARLGAMDTALAGGGTAQAEIVAARGGAASLKERLDGMAVGSKTVSDELTAARGGAANLDARLDAQANEISGLPWAEAYHRVDLNDANVDLGDALKPLVEKYKSVLVYLARDRIYLWNKPISLRPFQRLVIIGSGYENSASNIGVTIRMNVNGTADYDGVPHRVPVRVWVDSHAFFNLAGVNLEEVSNDTRPVGRSAGMNGIFSISGDFGTVDISQIRAKLSEDLVNIGSRVYGRVHFGWTYVEKSQGAPRDIVMVNTYTGHSFNGAGGVVSMSHTYPATGVTNGCENSARLICLP